MEKKKILITGSNGFAGKNLKEYLLSSGRAAEVRTPLRGELDLLDPDAVRSYFSAAGPEVVVHCATVGGSRKTGYDEGRTDVASKNLRMFFNLVRCLRPGMRMIHMGSGAEYDKRRCLPKMPEDRFDAHVPAGDYAYSKYVISKYIGKTDNIVCLRIFGLYGKYEDYTYKFISNAIVKNLAGLPITISQNVVFDFLWIGDFCKLVERFIGVKPGYAHYNITPTESVDLLTLAKAINSVSGTKSEIRVLNAGMNAEYTGSNRRMLEALGGFDFTPYKNGVKQLYSYYAARLKELDLDTIKKDPYLKLCRKSGGGAAGNI